MERAQHTELKAKTDQLMRELDVAKLDNGDLRSQVDKLVKELRKRSEKETALTSHLDAMTKRSNELQAEKESLEARLTATDQSMLGRVESQAKAENERLRQRIGDLESELNGAMKVIAEGRALRAAHTKHHQDLTSELQLLQSDTPSSPNVQPKVTALGARCCHALA